MKSPRLLILSASTGNGHMSAANAIAADAESQGLFAQVVDVLDFSPKGFRSWYRGGYEKLVRDRPEVWGHLYRSSDRPLFNYGFQTGLDWWFTRRIEQAIQETKPDWVVCTHSLPQPRLVPLRREYGFKIAIVVTDLYVHRMWLRGRPDYFFVPQEWSREVLMRRLPKIGRHSLVTGIPIHPVFRGGAGMRDWNAELSVLMSSGGIGGGPLVGAVRAVRDARAKVAVIAGRNESAKLELEAAFGSDPLVEVLGHVTQQEMADRMRSVHLLVGKSGGLTTFEALAVGVPFAVYMPFLIPGQEEGNAQFIRDSGAGDILRSEAELKSFVERMSSNRSALEKMSVAAIAQAHPEAAREIVEKLRQL